MADTTRLGLTKLEASQAQKHVTVNEALDDIDASLGLAYGLFGSNAQIKCVEEELTGLSGATAVSTIAFPNQCIVLGVSVRVTTAITGAASFDVGDGSTVDRFGGTLGITLGSTNQGTIGPAGNYSSTTVTLTANGGNFTAGAVRIALFYIELTPPTS